MTKRSTVALDEPGPRINTRPSTTKGKNTATHQRRSKVEVSILQQPVARLPHEMDESADHEASVPREIMEQAAADVSNGLKDTDRGAQVNLAYKKLKGRR